MTALSGNEHIFPQNESGFSPDATSILDGLSRARDASQAERLRIAALHTGHVAYQWNRSSDLISWSDAAAAVLGVDPAVLPVRGSDFSAMISEEDRERRDAMLLDTTQVDDGDGIEYDLSYCLEAHDGQQAVVLEERGRLICDDAGEVRDVIAVIRRAVAPAADQAGDQMKDPETALASKKMVLHALNEAARNMEDACCGLVLASISNLRDIIDTYGPGIVPDVIRATGARLRSVMRGADLLGRTGTAQFAVVLRECTSEQIMTAGERFVAAIRNELIETPAGPVWVELVAGAISLHNHRVDAGEAFGMAEQSLDQAAGRIGPAFVVYKTSPDHELQHERNRQSARDIVAALNEERFTLWHQPIVSAADQKPVMYESLLRMQSAEGEIISAGHLVPIAEKLGFMQMIDAIVCRTSLDLVASHPDAIVSFNMSDATLRNHYAIERLLSIVAESGNVARQVCIEVTHAALHRQVAGSGGLNAVARLRELGCRIAMNGYLTEGMSISLLNAVDIVKLGAEVCSGIADRSSDVGLLKAAIEFAHRAGVKVVAECVENERDAAVLAEAGVDYLQGYLYGQAAPEHFNLTLSPIDADRVNHGEARPERADAPVTPAVENSCVQPGSMECASAATACAGEAEPSATGQDRAGLVPAALLDSPEMDLLKAALGKLDTIQSL